jgi:sterol desaturase/sphingolipid hydroxylase (fatty acid hydroxylase superfamily)
VRCRTDKRAPLHHPAWPLRSAPISIFTFEHSRTAYRTDFSLYSLALVLTLGIVITEASRSDYPLLAMTAVAGMVFWTVIEYIVHRFVLHGFNPFRRLHAQHHAQPMAMVYAPTLLSAVLILVLIFIPARLLLSIWPACALTWGFTAGYLAYSITHHAVHHWQINSNWLKHRKRRHALHHACVRRNDYGVTSSIWDRLLAGCASRWHTSTDSPRNIRRRRLPSQRDRTP